MKTILTISLLSVLTFANNVQNEPLLTKYIMGKPYMKYIKMEEIVAKEWGINLKQKFGGCVISNKEKQNKISIEKQNTQSKKYYNNKFGNNWEKRFNLEVKERTNKK